MSKFKIEITSVPDRENLVAEIWFEDSLIAEVNQENDEAEIELYHSESTTFNLSEFLTVLETARNKLIE
jgi:hypothetical protein